MQVVLCFFFSISRLQVTCIFPWEKNWNISCFKFSGELLKIELVFRTYLIAAPRRVRPDETVQVYVSVMQIPYPKLTVRAAINRNGEEVISAKQTFHPGSTRLMQMKVTFRRSSNTYTGTE